MPVVSYVEEGILASDGLIDGTTLRQERKEHLWQTVGWTRLLQFHNKEKTYEIYLPCNTKYF